MNKGVNGRGAQKSKQGTGAPRYTAVYMAQFENSFMMKEKRKNCMTASGSCPGVSFCSNYGRIKLQGRQIALVQTEFFELSVESFPVYL
jgi:hypothetical protein